MYVMYEGLHSIIFENDFGEQKHTWDDWHLIPTKKPTMAPPSASGSFVDIPGRNGSYDLTSYLTGGPTYSDRSGTWEFIVTGTEDGSWDERNAEIAEFLHGQELKVILTDDPNYYYEGRLSITDKNTDGQFPKITISYRVRPFKMDRLGVEEKF